MKRHYQHVSRRWPTLSPRVGEAWGTKALSLTFFAAPLRCAGACGSEEEFICRLPGTCPSARLRSPRDRAGLFSFAPVGARVRTLQTFVAPGCTPSRERIQNKGYTAECAEIAECCTTDAFTTTDTRPTSLRAGSAAARSDHARSSSLSPTSSPPLEKRHSEKQRILPTDHLFLALAACVDQINALLHSRRRWQKAVFFDVLHTRKMRLDELIRRKSGVTFAEFIGQIQFRVSVARARNKPGTICKPGGYAHRHRHWRQVNWEDLSHKSY